MDQKIPAQGAKIALVALFLLASQFLAGPALAASQYFSPSAGSYSVNSTFSIGIYADSPTEAASAFSGVVYFPVDQVRVTGISKAGSIISLWVREPSFSNVDGTISFEGLIPNPGFTGSGGKILAVTFEALGSEAVDLTFLEGAVLANDGLGSDITASLGAATFALATEEERPQGDSSVPSNLASAPIIARPAAQVAGIQSAINSAFGRDVQADSGSLQSAFGETQGLSGIFLMIIKLAVLLIFLALIFIAAAFSVFGMITFAHHHTKRAVTNLQGGSERKLRRNLRRMRRDVHRNIHRLERLSRLDLSDSAKRTVQSTSKALVDFEDKVWRALRDLD